MTLRTRRNLCVLILAMIAAVDLIWAFVALAVGASVAAGSAVFAITVVVCAAVAWELARVRRAIAKDA